VSNHFLESCHIKKTSYSSLSHSSIPVQYSSPPIPDSLQLWIYHTRVWPTDYQTG